MDKDASDIIDEWKIIEAERKKITLPKVISRIHDALGSILDHPSHFAGEKYAAYMAAAILTLEEHGDAADDWLADHYPVAIDDELRRVYFARACLFAIRAERALQRGERDSAWHWISLAAYQHGAFEGSYRDPFDTMDHAEMVASGGRMRGVKNKPVRAKLLLLLREKRTAQGWSNVAEMIREVMSPLCAFAKIKGGTVTEGTIRRWLKEEEQLRAAFEGRDS
jgi:hypothetical protein